MRSQIIEIITDVEIYFKTQLAYFLGIKYGPLSYMNIGNFRLGVEKDHTSFLNSVEDFKAKNKNNPIIKHHNLNYSGDIPIWALVELLSFGSVSKLYTMLTTKDKKAFVRDAYANIGHNQLDSAIHAITALRNTCCHFQRLYRYNPQIKSVLFVPKTVEAISPFPIDHNTVGYILYLCLLLSPNEYAGKYFTKNILKRLNEMNISIDNYGLHKGWVKQYNNSISLCINKNYDDLANYKFFS